MKRALFVATTMSAALAGCSKITNALNGSRQVSDVLDAANVLDHRLIGTYGSAKLYRESDITHDFPSNGNPTPSDATYQDLVASRFASYGLPVAGLVERPQTFALSHLRALASLTQITRHDCVEGWSVVGKYTGVPLHALLALVRPKPEARYVVCYSFDRDSEGTPFYGSLDMHQASHPQTQLTLDLNDAPLDPDHGAPVRLRVPTQLAYKSTKWVRRIELVDSYAKIGSGRGGYWEDNGYAWYAGI